MRALLITGAVLLIAAGAVGLWLFRGVERAGPGPHLAVVATSTGLSPAEGEQAVALPIELALMRLALVERVETRIAPEVVTVLVWARRGVEPEALALSAREALSGAQATLPPSSAPPTLQRLSHARTERFLLESDGLPLTEVRAWAQEHLVRPTQQRPGVRSVELCGVEAVETVVRVDALRMRAHGVTPGEVLSATRGPALSFQLRGQAVDPKELLERQVGRAKLAELATVERAPAPARCVALHDGRALLVTVRSGEELGAPGWGPPPSVRVTALGAVSVLGLWLPSERAASRITSAARSAGATNAVLVVHPGAGIVAGPSGPPVLAELLVTPPVTREGAAALVRAVLAEPGTTLSGTQELPVARVVLSGPEREQLSPPARALAAALSLSPTLAVTVEPPLAPVVDVRPDRGQLARHAVTAGELADVVALAAGGVEAGGTRTALPPLADLAELGHLEVKPGVQVSDVATIEVSARAPALLRAQGQAAVEVLVFGASADDVRRAATQLALPPGVVLELE